MSLAPAYSSVGRPTYAVAVTEIRAILEDELDRWVAASKAAMDETDTVEGYLDWKRQARETVWLLAFDGERDLGTAIGIAGWHSPEGVARGEVRVIPEVRGRSVGSDLLGELAAWAIALGYAELMGPVKEIDADSLAWAERRGFSEVGRNSRLVLDLTGIHVPAVEAPSGIEVVSWAERPELAPAMYEVAREAYPDIPGEDDADVPTFDEWLSMDMQGAGDRPEATFVALEGDEVVGYAKLSISTRATERRDARHHGRATGLARTRDRRRAQGDRDRLGEGSGLRATRDRQRGAERAHPTAQRAVRVRPDAGHDHRAWPDCLGDVVAERERDHVVGPVRREHVGCREVVLGAADEAEPPVEAHGVLEERDCVDAKHRRSHLPGAEDAVLDEQTSDPGTLSGGIDDQRAKAGPPLR